jgi:hypothetical protein
LNARYVVYISAGDVLIYLLRSIVGCQRGLTFTGSVQGVKEKHY